MIKGSSYDPSEDGKVLRASKSSFMCYNKCPRLYWWRYIKLRDLHIPATPLMIKGSDIHNAVDGMYDDCPSIVHVRKALPSGTEYDAAYDAIAELEEQRREDWGDDFFLPLEHEEKWEVWDDFNEVLLVGKCDGVLQHPDGGLCLLELKTGDMQWGNLVGHGRNCASITTCSN